VVGLTAGALVLTEIYYGSGGSVLAVALWHALHSVSAATAAGDARHRRRRNRAWGVQLL
jgi:hypothetical protein